MADNFRLRMMIWRSIASSMRGVGQEDRRALRRSIRRAPWTSLRNLYVWADPVLLDDVQVEVDGVGKFNLRGRTDDLYIVLPSRESEVVAVLRERLGPGDTFVDAGANIGFFSIFAARLVGLTGKVIAIEMMPYMAAILRSHAALNECSNIQVVETAVSDRGGDHVDAWVVEGRSGVTSIVSPLVDEARRVPVRTRALEDILAGEERVALMKLDLEKAELLALRGAGNALEKIETIVFEQLLGEGDAAEFLESRGFTVKPIGGSSFLAERGRR
jgi:FkbM family methyltransferase